MNCKERNYELITDITAYPDDAVSFSKPMQVFEKHITEAELRLDEDQAIPVPMKGGSGKLEDSGKEGLQGTSYTVSITWEVDGPDLAAYQTLKALKNTFKHLIVTTFGGNRSLVRSCEDGWMFRYEESGGVIKCEVSVMNVSGVQRILG